jgi:hypothetical protein
MAAPAGTNDVKTKAKKNGKTELETPDKHPEASFTPKSKRERETYFSRRRG